MCVYMQQVRHAARTVCLHGVRAAMACVLRQKGCMARSSSVQPPAAVQQAQAGNGGRQQAQAAAESFILGGAGTAVATGKRAWQAVCIQ